MWFSSRYRQTPAKTARNSKSGSASTHRSRPRGGGKTLRRNRLTITGGYPSKTSFRSVPCLKFELHEASIARVGHIDARFSVDGDAPGSPKVALVRTGRSVASQELSCAIEFRDAPRAVFHHEKIAVFVRRDVVGVIEGGRVVALGQNFEEHPLVREDLNAAVKGIDDIHLALAPYDAAGPLKLSLVGSEAAELQQKRPLLVELLDAVVAAVFADVVILGVIFDDCHRVDVLPRLASQTPAPRQLAPLGIEKYDAMVMGVGDRQPPVTKLADFLGLSHVILRHPPLPQKLPRAVVHQHGATFAAVVDAG